MGVASNYLRELIARQVDEHKIVVWFDPERHYASFAAALALPATTIARYEGSFFALRHQLDHLLNGDDAPRLVVYVPLSEDATQDALVELTAAGVVLKPGQQPWQRNTRLSVVTRAALKNAWSEEQLNALGKQIESRQIPSLEEVEAAFERVHDSVAPGVLTLIFSTSDPEDIAFAFLTSEQYDAQIREKQASSDLATTLGKTFGAALAHVALPELRETATRHILCTDLLTTLREPIPSQLATVNIAQDTPAQEACQRLARRWRGDLDHANSYAQRADVVERELALPRIPFVLEQIENCDTFAAIERAAERNTENAWLEAPLPQLLEFGVRRQRSFWVRQDPQARARWELIATAGRVLLRAREIESSLRDETLTAAALLDRYIDSEAPWCELDTLHRDLEQRSHLFEFSGDDGTLDQLVARARRGYSDVGDLLATRFTHALETGGFRLPDVIRQRDLFARMVAPAVRETKTAYILVDALRYEMARELAHGLEETFDVSLAAAIASVPTITEIGMASLMPEVVDGAVIPGAAGKLALRVGDTLLRDRASRLEWLVNHAPIAENGNIARTITLTLDDLLSSKPATKSQVANADLIVVTSREIDQIAEGDNISLARSIMNDLLAHLARGFRKLVEYGCGWIIIAADHGYLFGDELDSAMLIDPPGGQTVDLHRRVWVGRGGSTNPAYLRTRLASFGPCADDLDLATPWGFGAFRSPGGTRAYFHGGLSLQELVVPVMKLTPKTQRSDAGTGDIAWTLTSGSTRITTRLYTVSVAGRQVGLFEATVPPIRVEVRAGPETISRLLFADYGLSETTQELQLQFKRGDSSDTVEIEPCSVVMEINDERAQSDRVTVYLFDVRTGRELSRIDAIELHIGIR